MRTTTLLLLLVTAGCGSATPFDDPDRVPRPVASASPRTQASPPPPASAESEEAVAREVAARFAAESLRSDSTEGPQGWLDRVEPLVTPEFLAELAGPGATGGDGDWEERAATGTTVTADVIDAYRLATATGVWAFAVALSVEASPAGAVGGTRSLIVMTLEVVPTEDGPKVAGFR